MHALTRCILLLCLVLVAGCSQDDLLAKFTPHPEAEIGRQAIDDWRTGHIDQLKPLLSAKLAAEAGKLREMSSQMPSVAPMSVKIVAASWRTGSTLIGAGAGNSVKSYDISYEYDFDGRWMLASVVFVERAGRREIAGIHATMEDQSLAETNAFSFLGHGIVHYLVLLLACASPLVCLTAFVSCLRTRMRRRKVWWALFTLIGFGTLTFNWTTGQLGLQVLSVQVFGASAFATPYGPWILGVSLPVGAIWFLLWRKRLTATAEDAEAPPALSP